MFAETAARGLGWAGIATGLVEILAPRQLERLTGVGNGEHSGLLRVLGVREVLQGVDILSHDDPSPGVKARIAGDVMDAAVLAVAANRTKKPLAFAAVSAMVLGIALADTLCAAALAAEDEQADGWWR